MTQFESKLDKVLASNKSNLSNSSALISFADLMTTIAVFFVLLLSMSDIRKGKFDALRAEFSGTSKGTLVELSKTLAPMLSKEAGVSIYMSEEGLRIDLETAALFDTGEAVLKDDSLRKLDGVLKKILSTSYSIDIEGHTDDRGYYRLEKGEVVTNWSLSGRRAGSVAVYLMDFGFAESRLRIVGYASNKPKVVIDDLRGNALDEARAQNRRVTLLVR